jgi:hypothetical protein
MRRTVAIPSSGKLLTRSKKSLYSVECQVDEIKAEMNKEKGAKLETKLARTYFISRTVPENL